MELKSSFLEKMGLKFRDFFEDKTIFLTGHTGFIGSWLAIMLKEFGANVIGYALPPYTQKDNFVVSKLDQKITSIIGDIRDYDNLSKMVEKYQPEIIYHLAAQPIVRKSYSLPKETYDTNIGGTVNIFESFKKCQSAKLLINFTTDKCYENLEKADGYIEEDRLGGYDPYSSSKACSELVTSAYRNSFFSETTRGNLKKVSSVRCGNIIGGGDWQEDRLIPGIMRTIKLNQEFNLRNPDSVRPWQFVLEPLRGFLILTMKMWNGDEKYSGAWNFGPKKDEIFTVKEIIEKILNYLDKSNYPINYNIIKNGLHETKLLKLVINKAINYLGWKPELSIDECIRLLCDWYMEENVDYNFNVNQINDYFNKITN